MKKNILSLAVASSVAGLAVTAQAAMYLNPEGTGEVLLFPYYNAQNENQTSISIVNTKNEAKAVKIRFMEYVNSQEVLDFNLYLSGRDHFAFTIYQNPEGDGGAIITRDNSCTVPELGTGSGDFGGSQTDNADGSTTRIQPFVNYAYGVTGTNATADLYSSITRSLVGHVEVIEMGVLGNADAASTTAFNPAIWATHGSNGVPANCAGLVTAWSVNSGTAGTWLNTAGASEDTQVTGPTGGLYGVANMLNNSDAAAYGMEAAAIADFWAGNTSHHEEPGDAFPSLSQGDTSSIVNNDGVAYTGTFSTGINAVSSLFMAKSISNDVMANPDLAGETDWVVTFPTRRYYVGTTPAVLPFTDPYVGYGTATGAGPESSCETVTVSQVDREESEVDDPSTGPQFSPAPPNQPAGVGNQLCYETNTIAINGVSALNASVSTADVRDAAVSLAWGEDQAEGWQTITFADANYMDATDGAADKRRIQGLPVMGFAAFEYTNGASNFGFVSDHKTAIAGSGLLP